MRLSKTLSAGTLLTILIGTATADDIDIYINNQSSANEPMAMFFLDYRPNLGSTICANVKSNCDEADYFLADPATAGDVPTSGKLTLFHVLRLSLKRVFARVDGVKVGLMLSHRDTCKGKDTAGPSAKNCSNGAYIPMGFESLNAASRERFDDILAALPIPTNNNNSHKNQGEEKAFELFRYLTGQGVYNGHNGYDDYFLDGPPNLDTDFPQAAWDETIEVSDPTVPGGSRYVMPLTSGSACGKIFLVNMTFGVYNHYDDSDHAILESKSNGGMGFPSGTSSVTHVDATALLYDTDFADGSYPGVPDLAGEQNVTSYFVTTRDSGELHNLASAGGTEQPYPLSEDPADLVETLEDILQNILSVSSTFVPVSLPVNAFNRAEVIDNVFLALFEAQAEGRPGWSGNLKKLRLDSPDESGQINMIDALGANAVALDGRIRSEALTFWTEAGELPPPDPDKSEVEGRDGRSVGRGGAGQQTPGFVSGSPGLVNLPGARTLFFDSGPSALAALNANSSTASLLQDDLEAASEAEAGELIAFARGLDIDDLDGDDDTDEARPWLMADPLHSRPQAINYGARSGHTVENPLIYIAVGTNDGLMHFIRNTTAGGDQLGRETWAFMPREVMGIVKPLRDNLAGAEHPYGVDGVPVLYKGDYNANGTIEADEHALLIFGLRRGGKAYYAIDISDPENPALRWTIRKQGDFAELGLTFSTPRIAHVNTGSGAKPVLIFAGGYDENKDLRGGVGSDDSEGNAIFVVDMDSGDLIWKAIQGSGGSSNTVFQHLDLTDSIPSDVTVADTDGDGLTDRVLVGDTGGNVWRGDLNGNDTSEWKLTRLAMLGRHILSGKANDRRFFHRPDFIPSRDENGPFDAVVLGSGDRADPKDQGGAADNYVFMVKDRAVAAGAGSDADLSSSQLADVTSNCLQDHSCTVPPDLTHGWRVQLARGGEKVLSSPLTVAGTVYVTSYVPPGNGAPTMSCGLAEGDGYLYALALQNATATRNYEESDDPPEGSGPNSRDDRDTQLLSSGIPAEVVALPPDKIIRPDLVVEDTGSAFRWKTYWYEAENTDL